MRLPMPFDPIEVGEVDNFAFDFTADVGAATITSTSWTCTMAQYQTATDPSPQSRVLSTAVATMVQIRSPLSGSLQMKTGFFSVASIGNIPATAVGGTYIIESTAVLSDGRILKLNSTILCTPPGD